MVRHQALAHVGEPPAFINHKTALSRRIKEAVRKRRWEGAGRILNSKSEYDRCHIPRLVAESEDDKKEQRLTMEKKSREDTRMMLETRNGLHRGYAAEIRLKGRRGWISGLFEDDQKPKRSTCWERTVGQKKVKM